MPSGVTRVVGENWVPSDQNFSRDPSRLTMFNNAPITFVQVRATFQLPSTATSNGRQVPSLFELYHDTPIGYRREHLSKEVGFRTTCEVWARRVAPMEYTTLEYAYVLAEVRGCIAALASQPVALQGVGRLRAAAAPSRCDPRRRGPCVGAGRGRARRGVGAARARDGSACRPTM